MKLSDRLRWGFVVGCMVLGAQVAVPSIFRIPVYAADLATIQERGYLVVAVKDNLRPLGFRDASGELVGLEIDIARRLAAELLGSPDAVVFEPVSNLERLPAVTEGQVDLAIAHLTVTGARSRIVFFSTPYYFDGAALVTRSPVIDSITHPSLQTVAALNGSTTVPVLRSRLPGVRLVSATSYQDAYQMLEAGEVDAFAGDAGVLAGWVQEYPQYRLLPTLLSGNALSIAMPRGLQYDELHRWVNEAIARWYEEGWLQERIRYWGLPE